MESTAVKEIVSEATLRNWKKLNTVSEDRLTKRANKIRSTKRILPLEYFSHKENLGFVNEILDISKSKKISADSAVLSLGTLILKRIGIYSLPYVQNVLGEYRNIPLINDFNNIEIPKDEADLLGLVYQCFLNEGKKNKIGSYYTPKTVTDNMTKDLDFSKGQIFLDPCCGSGAFLLSCHTDNPQQLYGIDSDKTAVMIAKINMLLKYPQHQFKPHIYCCDFLEENSFFNFCEIFNTEFDYIATNPPWGALAKSNEFYFGDVKETFSCFFIKSSKMLKHGGKIRFLFPEAILNVKCHKNIRQYILNNLNLIAITAYNSSFTGVVTKYVDIECENTGKKAENDVFRYSDNNGNNHIIPISSVYESENLVLSIISQTDSRIIEKVNSKGFYFLNDSRWALGIVTGDNKNKLFSEKKKGSEKIYTGKEITPYTLKKANNYIIYDRKNWQQAAKDELYRADEKLVYKFISKKLVFAYDDSKSLFLNSANILIPNIPGMSIKTVMAFLNSELFQFLYIKMFGEVKVLKGNLCQLPFPRLTSDEDSEFSLSVDEILKGNNAKIVELQNKINEFYRLSNEEIKYIRGVLNGDTDK